MKIVYFGTPVFSAIVLRFLLENDLSIAAIVTQPDRPKGRSLQMSPSPVKALVLEKAPHIPIFQPEKASNEQFIHELASLKADLFVVVAFGQILSQKLLDTPPLGCINVHPSLLPKYRGATPIQSCLMDGAKETGVVVQKMVKQMDAGDVIASVKMEVPLDMTFGELDLKLAQLSQVLLLNVIKLYEKEIPPATPQNHEEATYTSKIELEGGELDWHRPASELHNLVRAYSPRPGAWTWVGSGAERKRLKILRSRYLPDLQGHPGQLVSPTELIIACGQEALQLVEVQPEGKKAMSGNAWMRGQKSFPQFSSKNDINS